MTDPDGGTAESGRTSWTQRLEDMPERHRGRARAVAAMLGSASGVLLAAVAFGPAATAHLTRILGTVAGCTFAIAAGAFVTASLRNLGRGVIRRRPGTTTAAPNELSALTDKIENWTRAGGVIGALGVVALISAALSASISPTERVIVSARIGANQPSEAQELAALEAPCPGVVPLLRGEVAETDLVGSAPLLALTVDGGVCARRTVLVPRELIDGVIVEAR